MNDDIVDFLRGECELAKQDGIPEAGAMFQKAADELVRLQAIVNRMAGLDCCHGYSLSDAEYIRFWCVLDDAREAAEAAEEKPDAPS